jgi:hypothetical protein
LFMGICIGSAVIPLWNMMTWKIASSMGAVYAAVGGLLLGILGWMTSCLLSSGVVNVENLGKNETMLIGNLIAICSSGLIHYVHSRYHPQNFDFETLDSRIRLVEKVKSGLSAEDKDPVMLENAYKWIKVRGWIVTIILIVIWPLASVPAKTFSKSYFAFWVFVATAWGFISTLVITVLPIWESAGELRQIVMGLFSSEEMKSVDTDESRDEEDSNASSSIEYCALKNRETVPTI